MNIAEFMRSAFLPVAALMPIVNPLGSAPNFLSMSAGLSATARRRLSLQVGRNSFLLLAAAMLVGSHVLRFFGISVPIVRVGGGLLVMANGWRMLHADGRLSPDNVELESAWERSVARRAFYPLTFPLTVGPGSISIAITLGAEISSHPTAGVVEVATRLIGVALVALSVYLSYRFASRLIGGLSETGSEVFLRLSSFILLCVGVGIMWSGIVDLVESLPVVRAGAERQ
jgi:multiple antibiotic resistance protein